MIVPSIAPLSKPATWLAIDPSAIKVTSVSGCSSSFGSTMRSAVSAAPPGLLMPTFPALHGGADDLGPARMPDLHLPRENGGHGSRASDLHERDIYPVLGEDALVARNRQGHVIRRAIVGRGHLDRRAGSRADHRASSKPVSTLPACDARERITVHP